MADDYQFTSAPTPSASTPIFNNGDTARGGVGGSYSCGPGYEYNAHQGTCVRSGATSALQAQATPAAQPYVASPEEVSLRYQLPQKMAQQQQTQMALPAPLAAPPPLSPSSAYTSAATSGAAAPAPPVAPAASGGQGSSIPREAGPSSKQASDANLLRAKDRQGQLARGALTGLRAALGERQMLGSGAEGSGTAGIAGQALQNLSDVNREGLIQEDQRDSAESMADYQGRVAQRGQDIGQSDAMSALAAQARSQDIGAQVAYRGQDVTARGQDIAGNTAAGQLQLQQQNAILAALRQSASLY